MRTYNNKTPEYVWYIKVGENGYIGPYKNSPPLGRRYKDCIKVKFKIIKNE